MYACIYKSVPTQAFVRSYHNLENSTITSPPPMASSYSSTTTLLVLATMFQLSCAARHLTALVEKQPLVLTYHKGRLLSGPISLNLIWYGHFTPSQRAIVTDFLASLSSSSKQSPPPSVSDWWKTTEKYYHQLPKSTLPVLTLGAQTSDDSCSLGKQLTSAQIAELAARGGGKRRAISVVLTAEDVAVEGFCMSRCGTHGSLPRSRRAYIWVGNSASQCPGQCAWPFHQPVYGPQSAPLVAPNGDVGVEGMVMNLASLLAGTVTNPHGNGYFQGPREAPLEAASACTGIYGKGAYPGYAGDLLVDPVTGGSYNARGVNGRKYLLPALVDPSTSDCKTLV